MPSMRARLVNAYVRRKLKPLPLADMPADDVRAVMEKGALPFLPKGVRRETVASPVAGEWHRPEGGLATGLTAGIGDQGAAILYFHGGGYFFGSPRTHRSLTYRLAKSTGVPVFSAIYRLAPENPCPAAIDDAKAAYRWLLSTGLSPDSIILGGDSAGGGLALALMQALKSEGGPQPAGAVLYSPWVDLTCSGDAYRENAESDAMFRAEHVRRGGALYAGVAPLDDPRVSPLFGAFDGLAPFKIFVSNAELFRDDALRVAEKARMANVRVDLRRFDDLVHVWPVFAPLMPEAGIAIADTTRFVLSRLEAGRAA